jgi:hypothetical protein
MKDLGLVLIAFTVLAGLAALVYFAIFRRSIWLGCFALIGLLLLLPLWRLFVALFEVPVEIAKLCGALESLRDRGLSRRKHLPLRTSLGNRDCPGHNVRIAGWKSETVG